MILGRLRAGRFFLTSAATLARSSQRSGQMADAFSCPACLLEHTSDSVYRRWLERKARAHARRDKKRGWGELTVAQYKAAIHAAVIASGGRDAYTGEPLDWSLLSTYCNEDSKEGRAVYKARFALLPTVDHFDVGAHGEGFRICGWRTNDAKHDLTYPDFVALCKKVLEHAGYEVKRPADVATGELLDAQSCPGVVARPNE
jgi:hypothetical protein